MNSFNTYFNPAVVEDYCLDLLREEQKIELDLLRETCPDFDTKILETKQQLRRLFQPQQYEVPSDVKEKLFAAIRMLEKD